MRSGADRISLSFDARDPDQRAIDVAEFKGRGHPDSLADRIADQFSRRYARHTTSQFGVVANHWVDKVTLVGAGATVGFGGYDIHKPVDGYLFGKVTERIGNRTLDLARIFEESCAEVFTQCVGDPELVRYLRLHVNNTEGVGPDHSPHFYRPAGPGSVSDVHAEDRVANDTSACTGTSRLGAAGRLARALENRVAGYRGELSAIGTDVKVMVVRRGDSLTATLAVPVHPRAVRDESEYAEVIGSVRQRILRDAGELVGALTAEPWKLTTVKINTKDRPGRGYLAPFGTSLGKGDCGAVGRGNRYGGAIEPLAVASSEAPAGKNPLHHIGKIYTWLAHDMARRVEAETGRYAETVVVSDNGSPLHEAAFCHVALAASRTGVSEQLVRKLWDEVLTRLPQYTAAFLAGREPGHDGS
ncbi:methionine adenosyltransferase [Streptomyces sp. NPDC091416]|uniref:methionine adenosyltransferase n=1 Tax=Streptomyces sp. NPDC091416 TaxID=3366003 RepID=UPI00381F4B5A